MKKILVVDDEKPTLNMFRLFLRVYGYTVMTAENAQDGLEVFRKEKPSIILTDIKMPGMDGLELLQQIKTTEPQTEVIVITGHGDLDLAIQALDLKATDFINKPIQRDALDAALRRAEQRLQSHSCGEENVISLRSVRDAVVVDIKGDVTSRSKKGLTDALAEQSVQQSRKVVLHFEEICSVNGGGISVLIDLLSEMRKEKRRLAIIGLSPNFKKIFQMVGITKYADVCDTEEEAVAGSD